MFRENARIGIALVLSFILVFFIGKRFFVGDSPQIDTFYITSIPTRGSLFVSSLLPKPETIIPSVTQSYTSTFGFITNAPRPTIVPTGGNTFTNPTTQPSPTSFGQIPTSTPSNAAPTQSAQPTNKPKATKAPTKSPTKAPTSPPNTNCPTSSSEQYGSRGLNPPDLGANQNPDTVMSLRGWVASNGELKLVSYGYPQGEPPDPNAPQLGTIVNNGAAFSSMYRVLPDQKDNSLAGLTTTPGQRVNAPTNGYNIGGGYQYMVVYASDKELTMNVTGDDQAIDGYALHFYGLCVDPNLVALYRQLDGQGRRLLPALNGGQKVGTAKEGEVKVAIRDSGTFMDPRSKGDWWRGY